LSLGAAFLNGTPTSACRSGARASRSSSFSTRRSNTARIKREDGASVARDVIRELSENNSYYEYRIDLQPE
jgi:hypothetical protein